MKFSDLTGKKFSDLTEKEVEKFINDIESLSKTKTDTVYEVIGNALYDSGLKVSTSGDTILQPIMHDGSGKFNLRESFDFILDTTSLSKSEATANGKIFWQRCKDELQKAICTEDIKNMVRGKGTLDQWLKIGIPLVITALGIGTLNPVILVMIAAVLTLIIQVGLESYCYSIWNPQSTATTNP